MAEAPVITGSLVRLRPPRLDDAERMTALLQDSRVIEHLDRWAWPPYTIDKAVAWIEGTAGPGTNVSWAIECLADGAYIGNTGLDRLDTDNRRCSWGIWIAPPDRWGHGYGSEACTLAIGHAFSALGLEKVILDVYAGNDRARHVYEKAGFAVEGFRRRHHWNGRELIDLEEMAVFADNPLYAHRADGRASAGS
jgi:RimJ/RimL family protein N-acetyltransferase